MSFLLGSSPPTLTLHGFTDPSEAHKFTYYELAEQVKRGSPSREGARSSPLKAQVYDGGIVFSLEALSMESLPEKDAGVAIALVVTFDSRQLTIVGRKHDKFVVVYSTL